MNDSGFGDTTGGLPLFSDTTGGLPLFKRALRIQALCEKIEELEKHMDAQGFQTPADVLGGIVKPLFTQLGWEFADPRMVVPEFDRCFPAEAAAAWGRALRGSELLERFLEEMRKATGVSADRDRARGFIRGQVDGMEWSADPPDPKPARRVAPGDTVWVYDFRSREIVVRVVVDSDPDWEKGEVSRDSPVGVALLGAQEGEEREVRLPDRESRRARIVLIRSRARTG